MKSITRIRTGSFCFYVLIFVLCGCSSPEKNNSGEEQTADTSGYYIPKNAPSAAEKNKVHVDTVLISDLKFKPQEIKVHNGDTVVWINDDLVIHCVTEAHNMDWTSHQIPAGAYWKKKITQSADYYCTLHQVMKGKIEVADSSSANP